MLSFDLERFQKMLGNTLKERIKNQLGLKQSFEIVTITKQIETRLDTKAALYTIIPENYYLVVKA